MLDELDVRATFFVIGSAMEKYPEYGRKLAHHGHELGNHTFNHRPMLGVSYTTVAKELSASDALIRKAGYYGPVHFRPHTVRRVRSFPCICVPMNAPQ